MLQKKTRTIDIINEPVSQCKKYLSKWLTDQELHLSEDKKDKLALLLARYFSERGEFSRDDVMAFLGNMGGGHIDVDDILSVEIEIQRLIGHSQQLSEKQNREFVTIAAVAGLIVGLLIAGSLYVIARNLSTSVPPTLITENQREDLMQITDRIVQLQKDLETHELTQEEVLQYVGEPIGVTDTNQIYDHQFLTLKSLLNVWLEIDDRTLRIRDGRISDAQYQEIRQLATKASENLTTLGLPSESPTQILDRMVHHIGTENLFDIKSKDFDHLKLLLEFMIHDQEHAIAHMNNTKHAEGH